jgi:hypothetical protein
MDAAWEGLLDAEAKQSRKINGEIRKYTSRTFIHLLIFADASLAVLKSH